MTPSEQQCFDALTAANKWVEEAKPLLLRGGKCERAVEILIDELQTVCAELTAVQQENAAEMANPSLAINHSLNRVSSSLRRAREILS
jgi:hypothetical protein